MLATLGVICSILSIGFIEGDRSLHPSDPEGRLHGAPELTVNPHFDYRLMKDKSHFGSDAGHRERPVFVSLLLACSFKAVTVKTLLLDNKS